ncbi:DNA/RNA non-specific endonuclease [Agromyces sp. NPDC058126]|uniref:DNA/RNA non-specific endonuclease n=1 Tax=Agromyces sp. NPDC058126 TaxID=3346350 RepID=UPI0036DE072E
MDTGAGTAAPPSADGERHRPARAEHAAEEAKRFAALSGPFDPADALRAVESWSRLRPSELTAVASALSRVCEASGAEGLGSLDTADALWLIRGVERRRILGALSAEPRFQDRVAERRAQAELDGDRATLDLLDAVDGVGMFTDAAITRLLERTHRPIGAVGEDDRGLLARTSTGLSWASGLALCAARLTEVRAVIVRLGLEERRARIGAAAFAADAADAADMAADAAQDATHALPSDVQDWIAEARAAPRGRLQRRSLPVGAASAKLLDRLASAAVPVDDVAAIRLDFARPGLDVQDAPGLVVEFARQASVQLRGTERRLLAARKRAAAAVPGQRNLKGDTRESVPPELASAIGEAFAEPSRPGGGAPVALVVIEHLDALRSRGGTTHPSRLLFLLDELAELADIAVTAIGEGLDESGPAELADPGARLRDLNGRSDWLEGDAVFRTAYRGVPPAAGAPDAPDVLTLLWRTGRWAQAHAAAELGDGFGSRLADDLRARPLDAFCQLELAAELEFARLVVELRPPPAVPGARDAQPPDTWTELGRLAVDRIAGPSIPLLGGGALRFALHAAGFPVHRPAPAVDAAGSAVSTWYAPPSNRALDASGRRIDSRLGVDANDRPWPAHRRTAGIARSLAALVPHTDVLDTMSRLPEHAHLAEHAMKVIGPLDAVGLLAPGGARWHVRRPVPDSLALETLTDLGLLAEVAGLAAWLREDDDLRSVAAAAERWRRTAAGRWAYGVVEESAAAPAAIAVDVSIADRLTRLASGDGPALAIAELAAWHPDAGSGDAVLDLVRDRRPEAVAAAEAAADAADGSTGPAALEAAAAALLDGDVPAALVPGVATLLRGTGRRGTSTLRPRPPIIDREAAPHRKETVMSIHDGDEAQRLGSLRRELNRSDALRAAVERFVTDQRLPETVVPPNVVEAVNDRGAEALESADGVDLLEAIVQRVGRPPMLVRNGEVEIGPDDLVDFPAGTDALIKGAEALIPSVGRVEFLNHRMAWGGTGWVIREDGDARVVATNRHVAKLVAERVADGSGAFLRSPSGVLYRANLDFKEEVTSNPGDATPFKVEKVLYLADDLSADVALLRIVGDDLPSTFELADEEAERDALVAIIGYPAFDSRNDQNLMAKYFGDIFDVKRFAPGKVLQPLGGGGKLTHDCTTLGGNSGSPLFDLHTGKVVGLHFSGLFGVENSAVGAGTLRALAAGERPVVGGFVPRPDAVPGPEAAGDGTHRVDHFDGREGYDPDFLGHGLSAPWPVLSDEQEQALAAPSDADDDRPHELRYLHFGVKYHLARKQPFTTAVNIDGEHFVQLKRSGDKWFQDLRIPLESQLGKDDYRDRNLDRGHMVRRQDPNWDPAARNSGEVTELVRLANEDTFHYTNSALQHSRLNQGAQLWLGLEDYILNSAQTEGLKACVFTGPVLRPGDPAHDDSGVQLPVEFWKLVVMAAAQNDGQPKLHATAYVLSQGDLLRDLLEGRELVEAVEGFAFGAYRTFQVSVADLADALDVDLDHYLAADPLGTGPGIEAVEAGQPVFLPLDRFDQIVT